jgi:hypothetical protein
MESIYNISGQTLAGRHWEGYSGFWIIQQYSEEPAVKSIASLLLLTVVSFGNIASGQATKPYREIKGTVEEFTYHRDWSSYYWREDFTMLVKDDAGKVHRVISREPTPWTDRRLGTTFPGLKVDWQSKPRVHLIGVGGIDRQPEKFYDLKLDPEKTVTAFIVRVEAKEKAMWKDYYINNWFHHWGPEADKKMLAHYANDNPHYTVYGYFDNSIAAPFDSAGQELLEKYCISWAGIGKVSIIRFSTATRRKWSSSTKRGRRRRNNSLRNHHEISCSFIVDRRQFLECRRRSGAEAQLPLSGTQRYG